MSRLSISVTALIALAVALPAISVGGGGKLVDKDTGRKSEQNRTPQAVAAGMVDNPGRLRLVVRTQPKRKKVEYAYTTRCSKGNGAPRQFPKPGSQLTHPGRSKIKLRMGVAVKNPDRCSVQAAAKLISGKNVTVKIIHQP